MTKIIRKIDGRNALFGIYKYQVKPGSIPGGHRSTREWCRAKWGDPRIWKEHPNGQGISCWWERNPRWTEVKRPGYSTPFIYIRDDADAVMFGLVWTGK